MIARMSETRPKATDMLDDETASFVEVETSEQESDVVVTAEEHILREPLSGDAVSTIVETNEVMPKKDSVKHGVIEENDDEITNHERKARETASLRPLDNAGEASAQSDAITDVLDELCLNPEMHQESKLGQTKSAFDIRKGRHIVAEDEKSRLTEPNPKSPEPNDQENMEGLATNDDTENIDVVLKEVEENGKGIEASDSSNDGFDGPASAAQTSDAVLFTEVDKHDTNEIEEGERDIPASKSEIESIPSTRFQAADSMKPGGPGGLPLRRATSMISMPFVKRPSIVERMKEWQPLYEMPDLTVTEHPTVWAKRPDPYAQGQVKRFVKGALLHYVAFWLGANGKYKNQEMIDALSEVWTSKLWI